MCRSSWRQLTRRTLVTLVGLALITSVTVVVGSEEPVSAQPNLDTTMLVFDLSGSMSSRQADGRSRLQVAQQAMTDAIGGIAAGSRNMGVRSFSNCGVTTLEQAPGPVDAVSLSATINSLVPQGQTDIAVALRAVAGDFSGSSGRNSVILLSDGAHNCAGDPCQTAGDLIGAGIDIVVHAIGIGTAGTVAETELSCIANVTGGTVVSVDSADELFDAIDNAFDGEGATAGLVAVELPTCINSPMVQSDASLANETVGAVYSAGLIARRVLVTGEQCDFACAGGFDINCDGELGDFCDSAFDLNTVMGVGECLEQTGEGGEDSASDTSNALLEKHCLGSIIPVAPGVQDPPELREACVDYRRGKLFQDRADSARSNGDTSHAEYNQILADAAFAPAQEAVQVFCTTDPSDSAAERATAFDWTMDYRISGDDGLVLTDIFLGRRKMAERVSIPYLTARSGFDSVRIELIDNPILGDCPGATSRSRLMNSGASIVGSTVRVEATYRIDQMRDIDGVLTVTQRYEFDAQLADGRCEPSQESPGLTDRRILPCNPFRLTVSYDYDGTDQFEVEIPQRLHFSVEGRSNNAVTVFTDFDNIDDAILALGSPIRSTTTVSTERIFRAVTNGIQSSIDNYHQTYTGVVRPPVGFPVAKPGCPECVHIHWRWSDLISNPVYGRGDPLIPAGSSQSLQVGISRYDASELDPMSYNDVIDGDPVGIGGGDPVMWYISKSDDSSDSFFAHPGRGGAFFSDGYVDLAVEVDVAEKVVAVGETTQVTVPVRQFGPGDAGNVVVFIETVNGQILEDSLPSECVLSDGVGVAACSYDVLVAGSFRTIRLEARFLTSTPGAVNVLARATSDHVEFQEANDSDEVIFTSSNLADLSVEGSATDRGDTVTYQLFVENLQNFEARDAELTVQLPRGVERARVEFRESPGCSVSAQLIVTCDLQNILAFSNTTVTIVVPAGGQANDVVVAEVTSSTPDLDEDNNEIRLQPGQ